MLQRAIHPFAKNHELFPKNLSRSTVSRIMASYSAASAVAELSRNPRRSERKPLVTGINELKRRVRLQKKTRQDVREIALRPPENGLLVKRLVPIAHEVFAARKELYDCVSAVLKSIPLHVCRVCGEVHVGRFPHEIRTCDVAGSRPTKEHSWEGGGIQHVLPVVESFHLYDRLGRAVSHEEQLQVDRIPAIVELCVQAGMDIPEYPTKRRLFPVYSIAGKMIDFERKFPRDYSSGKDIQAFGFWEKKKSPGDSTPQSFAYNDDIQEIAERGVKTWEKVRSGAVMLMKKYAVQTCGYCPEVQVGPKGHRVRMCQAYKHQMRAGQHAWQEATIDDIVPPVNVWHLPDPHDDRLLSDALRRYYGKLPAVVELFAQGGAAVPEGYGRLMREDVAIPGLEEEKLAV